MKEKKDPQLLVDLFYAIGGSQAICQLRDCLQVRQQNLHSDSQASATDVPRIIESIDRIDNSEVENEIIRRWKLVQLCLRREKISQELGKTGKTVLQKLFHEGYPTRKHPDPYNMYPDLYGKLKNRLSEGSYMQTLTEQFGMAILALIPVRFKSYMLVLLTLSKTLLTIDRFVSIGKPEFAFFIDFLSQHRGGALRKMTENLEPQIFDRLERGEGTSPIYQFQCMESMVLEKAELDSDDIINSCQRST